jgi:aquaporin Z
VQLGAGLLAAVLVRTVIDPADLATTAMSTLTGHRLVGALAVGVICGDVFGPADTVWTAVTCVFTWPTLWVYWSARSSAAQLPASSCSRSIPMLNTLSPKQIQPQRVTT